MLFYIISTSVAVFLIIASFIIFGGMLKHQKNLALSDRVKSKKRTADAESNKQNERDTFEERIAKHFLFKPFFALFIGFSVSAFAYMLPVVWNCPDEIVLASDNLFTRLAAVLHNVIKLFVVDADFSMVTAVSGDITVIWFKHIFTVVGALFYVCAPVFTATFLFSFMKDLGSILVIRNHCKKRVYVFSELNYMSISIAKDIVKKSGDEKNFIIFTDVYDKEDESTRELVVTAERIGARCVSRDLVEIDVRWFKRDRVRKFYCIGLNQDENMKQALKILERYTFFYTSSTSKGYKLRKRLEAKILRKEGKIARLEKKLSELTAKGQSECKQECLKRRIARKRAALAEFKAFNEKRTPEIYVYASSAESEALLDAARKDGVHVRRINENRNLVFTTMQQSPIHKETDYFYEQKQKELDAELEKKALREQSEAQGERVKERENQTLISLAERALKEKEQSGKKHMRIAIIGLGGYGAELLKTFTWLGQVKGYELTIYAFDGENGFDKIKAIAPGIIDYNRVTEDELSSELEDKSVVPSIPQGELDDETSYKIHFYNNIDVNSTEFLEAIGELENLTSVYITLGNDSLNVQTAINIRRRIALVQGSLTTPMIHAVVFNDTKTEVLKSAGGLKTYDNASGYSISFIGDLETAFSQENVEQGDMEKQGLGFHKIWSGEQSYDSFEYFRRSSMAQALYYTLYRDICFDFIGGISLSLNEPRVEEFAKQEHARWNAYMRADGYVYSDLKGKDGVKKTHAKLTRFKGLTQSDIEKDLAYIKKRYAESKDEKSVE